MDEARKESWPSTAAKQSPDVTVPVPLDQDCWGRESGAALVQRQLHLNQNHQAQVLSTCFRLRFKSCGDGQVAVVAGAGESWELLVTNLHVGGH